MATPLQVWIDGKPFLSLYVDYPIKPIVSSRPEANIALNDTIASRRDQIKP